MESNKQIRLFVDAHCFDQEYQGSRSFLKGIYTLLTDRKNLHVFIAAYDTERIKKYFPPSERLTLLAYKSRRAFYRLAVDIPFLIRKHKIDYAHFQYITPLVKNCRQVVTIHDVLFKENPELFPTWYRFLKLFLYRRAARQADLITTVSAYSKKSIQKFLNVEREKIFILPNAVDPAFFNEYETSISRAYIKNKFGLDKFLLCVGRFEPRKNQLLLVQEFRNLRLFSKGYSLVLLGHQTLKTTALNSLLENLEPSIREKIFISSEVTDEDLLQFYRAADLFIYPSQSEGFGIPPLEAAAARVPVICSSETAMSDFLFFGNNHINPSVPGLLRSKIEDSLNEIKNQDQLESIAQIIKQTYSWKKTAEGLYQILLNHSIINHDQLSTTRRKKRRAQAELSYCETIPTFDH